jgi:hypothetical protein
MLFNGRGDYLLNLPALRALGKIFEGRLTLLCRPGAWRTFLGSVAVHSVLEPELRYEGLETRFDPIAVARELPACDLFLSLNPWHARITERLVELLAPDLSIGYHASFDIEIPLDFSKHNADLAFDLPRLLDPSLDIHAFAGPPALADEAIEAAGRILEKVPNSAWILAFHADTLASKRWRPESFGEVLEWLLARHLDCIVLDIGMDGAALEGFDHERFVPCRGLPLAVGAAIVGQSGCFLGVDSCFLHAADLFRVPGVGLFGPTSSREFGFRFGPHRHVQGPDRMDAIDVGTVIEAMEGLEESCGGFHR